jgi:hypothetical protein
MPNDAKLGLLAGVVGVIIAATISGKSLPDSVDGHSPAAPSRSPASQSREAKPAAIAQTGELPAAALPVKAVQTSAVRTKGDVGAIVASRSER